MKRLACLAVGIVLLGVIPTSAQDVDLSLSAGVFIPRQSTYRDIYGTGIPASLEIWVGLTKNLGASAGIVYLKQNGSALPIAGGDEEFPLKFQMVSLPLSLFYRFGLDNLAFRIGAGVAYHDFREVWRTVEADFQGTAWSLWLYAHCEVRLISGLSLIGSIRTANVPARSGSALAEKVDLGGITTSVGLSFRIR